MESLTLATAGVPQRLRPFVFILGLVFLLGSWFWLGLMESLFTESHLAEYYCCVTEQDLPARSEIQVRMHDFFYTGPGKELLPLLFVATSATIFGVTLRRAGQGYWLLPFVFFAVNLVYFATHILISDVTWASSNWANGGPA